LKHYAVLEPINAAVVVIYNQVMPSISVAAAFCTRWKCATVDARKLARTELQ